MPHEFEYDADRDVLLIRYRGLIDIAEHVQILGEVQEHGDFGPHTRGLSDFREAHFDHGRDDIEGLVEEIREAPDMGSRSWALLIDEPRKTAIGFLYQKAMQGLQRVEVFCTEKAALEWLTHDEDADEDEDETSASAVHRRNGGRG